MLNPRVTEVLDRWNRFQQQLYDQFIALLAEAEQDCAASLVGDHPDSTTLDEAWADRHARVVALGLRLQIRWTDEVALRLDALDAESVVRQQARRQLDALQDRMEIELEATRLRVFADAARSSRTRTWARWIVHSLCEEAAWDQWLTMRQAERMLHTSREETLTLLQAYEQAQIDYWSEYLSARVALLPETASTFESDLRSKLAPWYQQVDQHSAWARAGRTRALPRRPRSITHRATARSR